MHGSTFPGHAQYQYRKSFEWRHCKQSIYVFRPQWAGRRALYLVPARLTVQVRVRSGSTLGRRGFLNDKTCKLSSNCITVLSTESTLLVEALTFLVSFRHNSS